MCRRLYLLYHIENSSIEDVCAFVHRVIKVFILLVLLNCFKFVRNVFNEDWEKCTFALIGAVLILMNTFWLYTTKNNPTIENSNFSLIGLAMLCAFNLASLIFIVLTESQRGFGKLLGIIIQGSTFYIIYKLREKVKRRAVAVDDAVIGENASISDNSIQSVVVAVDTV